MTPLVMPQKIETAAVNLGCQLIVNNFENNHRNDGDERCYKGSCIDIIRPIKYLVEHIFPHLCVVGDHMMKKKCKVKHMHIECLPTAT